jgi:hypothetical protein
MDGDDVSDTPPCSGVELATEDGWMQPATLIKLCGDGLDEVQVGRGFLPGAR